MTTLKFYLSVSLFFVAFICYSQRPMHSGGGRQVMRYRSTNDSIRLQSVQQKIDELIARKKFSQKVLDSLMEEQKNIFSSVYYVTIYEPRKDFVLSDSLEKLETLEEVYRVSVYRKNGIPAILYQCKNLVALEIINCSLNELPQELNELPNLATVYLFNNVSRN